MAREEEKEEKIKQNLEKFNKICESVHSGEKKKKKKKKRKHESPKREEVKQTESREVCIVFDYS